MAFIFKNSKNKLIIHRKNIERGLTKQKNYRKGIED